MKLSYEFTSALSCPVSIAPTLLSTVIPTESSRLCSIPKRDTVTVITEASDTNPRQP